MSIHDQKEFLASIHPFELLNDIEMDRCIKAMDIAFYPKETTLISKDNIPNHFFIVIKGGVQEYNSDEVIREYHSQDGFDADSLIYGKSENRFVVNEDLICYELTKDLFLKLIKSNSGFKNFFLNSLVNKFQILKKKEYLGELSSFMIARVNEIYIHKPCIVDANTSLKDALKLSMEQNSSSIIVKDTKRYGIITDYDLKRDILLDGKDLNQNSINIAKFPLISINHDDFLFNALLIFTKHNIKRVAVMKNGEIVGILEQLDLLSHFANHAHLVDIQIKKAKTKEELKSASLDLINIVKTLHSKGVKVNYIAKLITELNSKIYKKLFSMIVPQELLNMCCFIVMGSEGRSEQIIKTDQDNALIINNDIKKEQFYPLMREFSDTLIDFGYPKCKGNIMVSNPYWCKSYDEYKNEIERWIEIPEENAYMNLAIFFDSSFIAGDEKLLNDLQNLLFRDISQKDIFLAYFAKATLAFETPIGMFSNLITKDDKIDIKKGGIFPIVQGIRSLSLKFGIRERATVKRIKNLYQKKILTKELASELLEAFDAMSNIRLKAQLNNEVNSLISPEKLGKLERDLLKDSFKIVNDFKKFISHHFKLDLLL